MRCVFYMRRSISPWDGVTKRCVAQVSYNGTVKMETLYIPRNRILVRIHSYNDVVVDVGFDEK